MADLVEFLRARLDEDEQVARAAGERNADDWLYRTPWRLRVDPEDEALAMVIDADETTRKAVDVTGWLVNEAARHIVRHDPARVLADMAAKRRVVSECAPYSPPYSDPDDGTPYFADLILRLLALPYREHPSYKQEWTPEGVVPAPGS